MMTPMFLNHKNTEYFDLNQDHSLEAPQHKQVPEISSSFYPRSVVAASSSSLQLEQALGMRANHSISDHQPLAFDHLKGSNNMFFDMVPHTYGVQMSSTNNQEIFIFKQQEDHQDQNNQNKSDGISSNNGSLRWMSSKMRMMRRMINNSNDTKIGQKIVSRIILGSNKPDHSPSINVSTETNIDDNNNGIRVCSDCNTTKTPLWRSGPQGPKTLCNACGIRQRKARKAAMEAAAAAASAAVTNSSCEATSSSTSSKTTIKLKINKEKNKSRATSNNDTGVSKHMNKKQTTYNKQQTNNNQVVDSDHTNNSSTSNSSSKRQMFFDQFAANLLNKNAAFHRMFPEDEEEGALLLMALSSYGFTES